MEKEKIISRGFVFSFIAEFCSALIFYMLISTVTDYARVFGAGSSLSGLVSGIFVIGVLITRFLFSRILQLIGWRRMMIFAQSIHLASCFLYFAINSLTSLVTVRFVHGLCYGLSSSANLSTGMNQIPRSRYGEGNGYLLTSITLAVGVGPYLGGEIYDRFGAHGCFTATVVITAIMFACIMCVRLPEDKPKQQRVSTARGLNSLIEVAAIPITVCVFISSLGYSSVLSFLRLYGKAIDMEAGVGIFFLVYAVVLVLSRPAAGKIQDKYGDAVVMFPCALMQIASHLLLALWPTTAGLVLSGILCATGYGTLSSCVSAIASREADFERKSYAVATYWIGCDLANGLGPVALGAVTDSAGYPAMYAAAAAIAALVIPVYWLCRKKRV